MLIDYRIVVVQIINFLILVWLLQRFLYGPITRAMEERKKTILDQLERAEQRETLAQQETQRLQQMQQDFAAHREQRIAELRSQLEDERLTLLERTKDEVAAARDRWYRGIAQEKATVLRTCQQQTTYQVTQTLRQVLTELADASLEHQIVNRFLARLAQLPEVERTKLRTALTDAASVQLYSSFPLSAVTEQAITEALHTIGPFSHIQYDINPALVCGLELNVPGYCLDWNLARYLETLEQNLTQMLDRQVDRQVSSGPAGQ
ncbi:atp synthase subunit b [Leptolyngbya sp. Heron Island J]|uniref:F0F1 ATP synthase subunit B family protein n=1 Tax=Leptolyngbya sp. Heron Island J TaxID=1385935 RepID=UPI0003B9CC6A|nr:ATP synthase subunit B [Leptolyngbya sp. Heron Island J]ESA37438.1 atp synthase subunit b [Leptolyngbya sp. Heron Island J]